MDQIASYQDMMEEPLPKQGGYLPGTVTSSIGRNSLHRLQARARISISKSVGIKSEIEMLPRRDSRWLPDALVMHRLHRWFARSTQRTLWTWSPTPSTEVTSSHAAATSTICAAGESDMPIIHHFCQRPRYAEIDEGRDVERFGLIILVYHLISQLLQFDVEDDQFEIHANTVDALDGEVASWPAALQTLSALLQSTSSISLCVIGGLNDRASAHGADWCRAFLEVLYLHQRSSPSKFRVLITTSGSSRVLQEYIDVNDCELAAGLPRNLGTLARLSPTT